MLTVNFVLMTICVTIQGTPRLDCFCVELSVTIFQVPLSQINTGPITPKPITGSKPGEAGGQCRGGGDTPGDP